MEHIFYYWDENLFTPDFGNEEDFEMGGSSNFTIVQNISQEKTYFYNEDDSIEGFRLVTKHGRQCFNCYTTLIAKAVSDESMLVDDPSAIRWRCACSVVDWEFSDESESE